MMSDWKSIVRQVAPTIATALGGPLAGLAAKTLGDGLLGDSRASESDISQALLDPDGLLKLKTLESEFKIKMRELDVNVYTLAQKDRESARSMAIATGNGPQVLISSIFIGGFFLILWILFVAEVTMTESQDRMAYTLLGILGSAVTMIIKFWFGGGPNDLHQMNNVYNSIPREQLKK